MGKIRCNKFLQYILIVLREVIRIKSIDTVIEELLNHESFNLSLEDDSPIGEKKDNGYLSYLLSQIQFPQTTYQSTAGFNDIAPGYTFGGYKRKKRRKIKKRRKTKRKKEKQVEKKKRKTKNKK